MAEDPQSACPVDHKTRDAWISHAREIEAQKSQAQAQAQAQPQSPAKCPIDHSAAPQPKPWIETIKSYIWSSPAPTPTPQQQQQQKQPAKQTGLDTDRVVSSIPRTTDGPPACPVDHGDAEARPANHEMESGVDPSGNWVYPSERMFFDAMKRKGYDARVADMKTVVPIHNAVNERAWKKIQEWEAPYLATTTCGGPKLASFANKNDRMTPTARINTLLGYTSPFDRHDWVIDRCGTRVDYVIDFYAGRPDGKGGPSFYLDVRPKLNTWEGVKMRAMKWAWLT